MIRFSLAKCKTKAAYSARLLHKGKLDLQRIKNTFETILETPILLVVKIQGMEIIVHGYGELMFKTGKDVALMEKIAEEIYETGLK